MHTCTLCKKQFNQTGHYNRHIRNNAVCNAIKEKQKEIEDLQKKCLLLEEVADKRKEKFNKLKIMTLDLIDYKNSATEIIKKLKREQKEQEKKHQKEIYNLQDEKNLLYHDMMIAKTRVEEKETATDKIIEAVKVNNKSSTQNNTIIQNNTVVLQDFRIMPVKEFSDEDLDKITDVIRDNDVYKVCLYILQHYYYTIPPNIIIQDQARKKISLVRNNEWVQANWNNVVDDLYYRSFQQIAYTCIGRVQEKHRNLLKSADGSEEKERYEDEILIWDFIRQTWDNCKPRDLSNPLIVGVKNAQEAAIKQGS